MKLHLSILEKLIELQTKDPVELRHVLDDLGLEVKGVEGEGSRTVYNIETLANRGDHLHALGVARELSARILSAIKQPTIAGAFGDRKASVPVRKNTPLCLAYALLELTLPKAMKLRSDVAAVMQAQGMSEKPAIVDLLNYVLLELGQPMHAFDRDKIEGEIIIEVSTQPEEIEGLDGKTYKVPANSLLIKDKKKTVAVAGVIGCANSMVTTESTRVLIESAAFDPVSVRKTARAMGISTDASYVFERGCDVEAIIPALRRLVHLAEGGAGAVREADGAHVIGCTFVENTNPEKRKIALSLAEVRRQMNLPRLADTEVTARLKYLGFGIENAESAGQWKVSVPSWRLWDIKNQEDLVEDLVRSLGFSRVKQDLPPLDYETPEPSATEALMARLEPSLLGQGFYEVMTRSFYSAQEVTLLEELDKGSAALHIPIKNSLERGYSHLKITNVWHLASVLEQNLRRGVLSAKVFELGRFFSPSFGNDEGYKYEKEMLTLAMAGRWYESEWRKPETSEQKFGLFKGVLENLVAAIGQEATVSSSEHPFLHPGYQGSLKAGRMICGTFGIIHPLISDKLGSRVEVLYAELDVSVLSRLITQREFKVPSDFPAVKRDVTLKVKSRELAQKVVRAIEELKISDLAEIAMVDDFRRENEDFRRLTLRLVFQSSEKTLESAAVDTVVQDVLGALKEKLAIDLAL